MFSEFYNFEVITNIVTLLTGMNESANDIWNLPHHMCLLEVQYRRLADISKQM